MSKKAPASVPDAKESAKVAPPKKTITKPKKKPEAVTIGQILDHAAKLKYDERKLLISQLNVLQQASAP